MNRNLTQMTLGVFRRVGITYLLVTAALVALAAPPAAWAQTTWHVDDDASLGGDGMSWTSAFKYLQDALALAEADDEIRVAAGIYKPDQDEAGNVVPGAREATFELVSGVGLYGGYAGQGAADPDQRDVSQFETILSGDLNGDDGPAFANYGDNSLHVAYGGLLEASTALDGFVLTGGNADGTNRVTYGGGLRVRAGSIEIANCTFRFNRAETGGGMVSGASASIVNCRFSDNRADWGGGAITGECAPIRLVNCVFDRNISLGTETNPGGGAIDVLAGALDATNCSFFGNSAVAHGGAIRTLLSPTSLTNCAFSGNHAGEGGAIRSRDSSLSVSNCVLSGNWATGDSGGIHAEYAQVTIANSVLWDNHDANGTQESAQVMHVGEEDCATVSYCCIQNYTGSYGDLGVVAVDPLFVDADGADDTLGTADDDLQLAPNSPCIDAGDNDAVPWDLDDLDGDGVIVECMPFDLAGNPRFLDDPDTPDTGAGTPPIVDMGAFELLVPGLVASVQTLTIPEGSTATFTVSLSTAPDEPVTVTVTAVAGDPDITVESGASLEFGAGNFNIPQLVTLAAAVDGDDVDGEATIEVAAPGFAPVAVIALEDDAESGSPVVFVDAGAAPGGDGTSWGTAFADLQDGLDASDAIAGSVEIWVVAGTYTPDHGTDDPAATFELRNNVALLGGFVGGESELEQRDPVANLTVLSGDLGDGVYSEHVVTAADVGATAVVDGFTICDGWALGVFTPERGGAVYILTASPTLRNCTFVNNQARFGGAIYTEFYSSLTLVGCTFMQNTASYKGGAVFSILANVSLTDCVLVGNVSQSGGAIMCEEGECWLANCRFLGNTATGVGGAVQAVLCDTWMMNCLFSGNDGVGAVHLGDGWADLANCVFSRNGGPALFILGPWGGARVTVHNSVFWANGNQSEVGQILLEQADQNELAVNYACIQGWTGALGGIGNHGDDPLFVDADGADDVAGTLDDDLHLSAGSPCIDVGSNWLVPRDYADLDGDGDVDEPTPLDLDREDRFVDDPNTPDGGGGVIDIVDMGVYEFGDSGRQYCLGDLTGDGECGLTDLIVLLGHYGMTAGAQPCDGDIDYDGDVDLADLAWLLGEYGMACD